MAERSAFSNIRLKIKTRTLFMTTNYDITPPPPIKIYGHIEWNNNFNNILFLAIPKCRLSLKYKREVSLMYHTKIIFKTSSKLLHVCAPLINLYSKHIQQYTILILKNKSSPRKPFIWRV